MLRLNHTSTPCGLAHALSESSLRQLMFVRIFCGKRIRIAIDNIVAVTQPCDGTTSPESRFRVW